MFTYLINNLFLFLYQELFQAFVPFLQETLGGGFSATAKTGMENACALLLAALRNAL